MRLIDADALLQALSDPKGLIMLDGRAALVSNEWGGLRRHEDVIAVIESATAIEAEPVRRGRWVKQSTNPEVMQEFHAAGIGLSMGVNSIYWTCSECGAWGTPVNKYCPNCGAKMDGGADNG